MRRWCEGVVGIGIFYVKFPLKYSLLAVEYRLTDDGRMMLSAGVIGGSRGGMGYEIVAELRISEGKR